MTKTSHWRGYARDRVSLRVRCVTWCAQINGYTALPRCQTRYPLAGLLCLAAASVFKPNNVGTEVRHDHCARPAAGLWLTSTTVRPAKPTPQAPLLTSLPSKSTKSSAWQPFHERLCKSPAALSSPSSYTLPMSIIRPTSFDEITYPINERPAKGELQEVAPGVFC